jgi:hypothetical protein
MVSLKQTRYIERLSQKFGVDERYPAKVPMAKAQRVVPRMPEEMPCTRPYKELIGCLIYVSTCTRPDISFAVNRHAQFFFGPFRVTF